MSNKLLAVVMVLALTSVYPAVGTAGGNAVLWRDPGPVEQLDFEGGPGGVNGRPKPPFRFVDEILTGSTTKIRIDDAEGVRWMVKFGEEVKAQTFAARFAWAAGYFALPIYFIADGTIKQLIPLKRAAKHVGADGRFANASFERYIDSSVEWLSGKNSWSWNANPFVGTPQLNGLKVLLMLLSDWDNKDARDLKYGSNTAILVYPNGEVLYMVSDWGATLGAWGNLVTRSKWNCADFQAQTHDFVSSAHGQGLRWGYVGHDAEGFTEDIRLADVHWLLTYVGRLTDAQLSAGLIASGADEAEAGCFVLALRKRIEALQALR